MDEETSHALEPVPLAGQRITIQRMNGLRQGRDGKKWRPGIDGQRTVRVARTPRFTPFSMGPFKGHVERRDLGGPGGGAVAFVLRNFDGARGGQVIRLLHTFLTVSRPFFQLTPSVWNAWQLARSLEGCYGLDCLEGKGSGA